MAMLPFAGYNFGDYWKHWLEIGSRLKNPPKIFHVNWFRRDASGKFLWPGFGDNLRVIEWMLKRHTGNADAQETAIGRLPKPSDINLNGLEVSDADLRELLTVDAGQWRKEVGAIREYFAQFGARVPPEMKQELEGVEKRLG
jgi:phosphoenolpyruvate carboxykinase (GTP)